MSLKSLLKLRLKSKILLGLVIILVFVYQYYDGDSALNGRLALNENNQIKEAIHPKKNLPNSKDLQAKKNSQPLSSKPYPIVPSQSTSFLIQDKTYCITDNEYDNEYDNDFRQSIVQDLAKEKFGFAKVD